MIFSENRFALFRIMRLTLLRQREAVGAGGVGLIEPDRLRVIFEVLGSGLLAGLKQRHRRHHQVVALRGRRVAQEFVETARVDLVAIELRALARGVDLDVVDLAGVADRLRRARLHDAPEADAGAEVWMLLDHGRGDVERGVGVPVRRLVRYHLDVRVVVQDLHDAADLIDAGGRRKLTLHDLHLARLARAGAALLDDVGRQYLADLTP